MDDENQLESVAGRTSIMTNRDKDILVSYIPSKTEEALLDVLLDPFRRRSSVTRKCELAGISRQTYYQMMKRPDFMAYYKALSIAMVKEYMAPLLNLGMAEALKGGTAGFGYWKEMLKIGQVIEDESMVNIENNGGEITVRFADPDDDY